MKHVLIGDQSRLISDDRYSKIWKNFLNLLKPYIYVCLYTYTYMCVYRNLRSTLIIHITVYETEKNLPKPVKVTFLKSILVGAVHNLKTMSI